MLKSGGYAAFAVSAVLGWCLMVTWSHASAPAPRALPSGAQPKDRRLEAPRTLNGYFPMAPVADKAAWADRAQWLRRQTLVSNGLWPMPTRAPLNARIHGKVERDDFTVERVVFESVPGHFVTGSLFRPKNGAGKRPVVLCPHGHWNNGRFYDHGVDGGRREIATGAERFEDSGRYPLQARCVQLARMGCVVFHYDMLGYADSIQLAHRPGVRDAMNTANDWGFFSPRAELRLQNMMGLQTWNSIRALDFVLGLPDVDPRRVGVTGASGGGTQTFMLLAVDDRPTVGFPAVMVSTGMQGGCTCENAPYLRVNAGNIDLAALTAPRPLGMVAADDWTKDILTKGMPELKKLYALLGKPDLVQTTALLHFPHNYNAVSRMAMYNWFNKHLQLGQKEPVIEKDFKPLSKQELTVWTKENPAPSGDLVGDPHERALLRWFTHDSETRLRASFSPEGRSVNAFSTMVGGGWESILGRRLRDVGPVTFDLSHKQERDGYLVMTGVIQHPSAREQLPALFFHPKNTWNNQVVIWLHEQGKAGLCSAGDQPIPAVAHLVRNGFSVVGIDLLHQGEFTRDGKLIARTRLVENGQQPWQQFAGYTFGYNPPLFCQRVHDVLTTIRFVQTNKHQARAIHLVGMGRTAGSVAAATRFLAGNALAKTALANDGFRFAQVQQFDDPMFVPGAVKYWDVPALLALSTQPLWLANADKETVAILESAQPPHHRGFLTSVKTTDPLMAAAHWIVLP